MRAPQKRLAPCILLLLTCWAAALSGCHTARRAAGAVPAAAPAGEAKALADKVEAHRIPFRTFSARAKLDISNDQGRQEGITTFIRMQKDSAIWISVRPLLGIELVRVLITPDSVQVLNFFQKTCYARSTDSLRQLTGIPLTFDAVQDLIVGNPAYLSATPKNVERTASLITFLCDTGDLLSHFAVFADDYQLQEIKLQDQGECTPRSFDQVYGDYEATGPYRFATRRRIFFSADRMSQVDIKFNRVDFDKALSFPFPVTDKFSPR